MRTQKIHCRNQDASAGKHLFYLIDSMKVKDDTTGKPVMMPSATDIKKGRPSLPSLMLTVTRVVNYAFQSSVNSTLPSTYDQVIFE